MIGRVPTGAGAHEGKDYLGSDLRRRTTRSVSVLRIGHRLIAGCDPYATITQARSGAMPPDRCSNPDAPRRPDEDLYELIRVDPNSR